MIFYFTANLISNKYKRAVTSKLLLLSYLFSHERFATVHEVLQADWHEFAHSLQPGFFKLSFNAPLFIVFICFILTPPFALQKPLWNYNTTLE
jgi:hypothetical protein